MLTLFKVKCILIGFEVRIRMISKTLVVVIDIVLGVNFQHIYGIFIFSLVILLLSGNYSRWCCDPLV